MQRASKRAADDLAKSLTELAVMIATEGKAPSARRSSSTGSRSTSGSRRPSSGRSSTSGRSPFGGSSRGAVRRTSAAARGGRKSSTKG